MLQLDPSVDIRNFNLSAGANIVARALQRYGAVNVDVAGGTVLYGEGLYGHKGRSWDGILDSDDLRKIPISLFRVLKLNDIKSGGLFFTEEKRRTIHDKLWNI